MRKYWNDFYKKYKAPILPSSFAKFILRKKSKEDKSLLELGCGNGRDSLFFMNNNIRVTACDSSTKAINEIKNQLSHINIKNFHCIDFTKLKENHFKKKFDLVYSRFTLHSISYYQEKNTINWIRKNLKKNGKFCFEARSTRDPLMKSKKAKNISKNTYEFEKGHIRRFIDIQEIKISLLNIGFKIDYLIEKNNVAKYKNDNPFVIRCVARKY